MDGPCEMVLSFGIFFPTPVPYFSPFPRGSGQELHAFFFGGGGRGLEKKPALVGRGRGAGQLTTKKGGAPGGLLGFVPSFVFLLCWGGAGGGGRGMGGGGGGGGCRGGGPNPGLPGGALHQGGGHEADLGAVFSGGSGGAFFAGGGLTRGFFFFLVRAGRRRLVAIQQGFLGWGGGAALRTTWGFQKLSRPAGRAPDPHLLFAGRALLRGRGGAKTTVGSGGHEGSFFDSSPRKTESLRGDL